jgi:MtN3 and saliva related transmembrane protein
MQVFFHFYNKMKPQDDYYWLGFMGGVLTTFSFVPQILKTIKTKDIDHVSFLMYIIISIGFFLWTIYGVLLENWVIFIFNLIALAFTITIMVLFRRHSKSKSIM